MKRLAVVPIVLVLLLSAPAYGAGITANRDTSGPFTGTTVFNVNLGGAPCEFVHQTFNATYTTDRGKNGSFSIDGCVEFPAEQPFQVFAYDGTFALTTPNHATLRGTVAGAIEPPTTTATCSGRSVPESLSFTLVATSGTKQLQHVSGSIELSGTWCSGEPANMPAPIFGTLTANLR